MNDINSPPLAHGDPARVLGVTELLENVLCNLSPGDILKSAQAVSKFWRDCVQGSTAVKKKCFLIANNMSEEETDRRLFLGADLPDFSKSLVAEWRQSEHTRDIAEITVVTPATLRAFFADDSLGNRDQYKQGCHYYFEKLEEEEDEVIRLRTNMGREGRIYDDETEYDTRTYESLLDMSRLNPQIRGSWKGKGSAVFTGHKNHLIFALGDNYREGCDYFTHIRTFLETFVHAMNTDHLKQTWKTVQISSPAVIRLTVTIWLPGGPEEGTRFRNESGVTMLDFANIFTMTLRDVLERYDSFHVEHWLGRIHRQKRGDTTWKRSMRLYKKGRDLIEKLVDQLEKGRWQCH